MKYIENIKMIDVWLINFCNLKCTHCDIWKNKDLNDNILNSKDIDNILNSEKLSKCEDFNFTWWEPFLHPNINEIYEKFLIKWKNVSTISTNLITQKKIINFLNYLKSKWLKFPRFNVSIDWMEKNHDLQRWIEWSFNKTIKNILLLKDLFPNLKIKIKFTISNSNIEDIENIHLLAEKLDLKIWIKIIEYDKNYTNKFWKPNLLTKKNKNIIIEKIDKIYRFKSEYIKSLIYFLENKKLNFHCFTPKNFLFIFWNWDCHTCSFLGKIWNIKKQNIDDIIFNEKHQKLIKKVETTKCHKCLNNHWSLISLRYQNEI